MSLSSWIRDYIYIPLGGSQQGPARTTANLFTTMFLAGLWHGAGWTYIVWGLLHGFYLVAQRTVSKPYHAICAKIHCPDAISSLLAVLVVFALTCFAWIFFRAKNLDTALYIVKALFSWEATAHLTFGGMKFQLLRVAAVVAIVLSVDFLASREKSRRLYLQYPYARVLLTGLVVLTTLFTGRFDASSFIYFQF